MLEVEPAAVSQWHTGKREPDEDGWAKLLTLKECLETTGQLCWQSAAIGGNLEGGEIAKMGKNTEKPVPPDIDRERELIVNR